MFYDFKIILTNRSQNTFIMQRRVLSRLQLGLTYKYFIV